jgi:hypothetical protein
MSNARTMVGVIKGNTNASYDANWREKCMTEKKKRKEGTTEWRKYTYGGGHDDLLSPVIGKIRVHQGAFCRDPLGTVV